MRDLFTVASFTIKEMVKKKSFIVSNIIFLIIILVGTNVPRLLESLNGQSEGKKVLIVDTKNIFEGNLESLKTDDSIYDLTITNDDYDKEKIKSLLENGDYEEVITLDVDKQNIIFNDYQEEASLTSVPAEDLMTSITNIYYAINLSKIGLSEEQLSKLNITSELNNIYIKENNSGNSIFAMMMFSIVLFYAVFFCASQVSASVTTEKTSKIIESLTTSTSPKYIVLGKTLGVGVVGLLQLLYLLIALVLSGKTFLPKNMLEGFINFSSITPLVWITVIIYFILGYALYALIFALTGSLVQKPEDIQNANSPVSMISVFAFYLAYFAMMNPSSSLSKFASLFPFSAAFSMPSRVLLNVVSIPEFIGSIIILIITCILIGYASIKVYSNAILNYGSKFSLKDIKKYLKQK